MTGSTIFITYVLVPTGGTYGQGIHCNYIKKLQSTQINPYITEINLSFSNPDDFKFLSYGDNKTGYTANKIYAIVQIVDNVEYNSLNDVSPDSTAWKYLDISGQITGYDGELTPTNLTSQVFKIPFLDYKTFPSYKLDYLNYPTGVDGLAFGDESYFFGNVSTSIKADVYTANINIGLPQNEFNSTTNKTWDGSEKVYISEIGIYDSNKNLVAIGKLNDPVPKDSTIGRTIVFDIDF